MECPLGGLVATGDDVMIDDAWIYINRSGKLKNSGNFLRFFVA